MSNDVTKRETESLPAHLAQYGKAKIGNVDVTDLIIPRIKLMQALSPELTAFPQARPGTFWHNIADLNLGDKLLGVPIVIKKSYMLWSPRNDDRGILARAMDGVHWDQPGAEFTVKPKGSPTQVTYKLAETVAESGLDQFGSSIPGDANSVPAASLTYNMLWYFPEHPTLSPAVIINTRSAIKPVQTLLSKIDSKPVAHYAQLYEIGVVQAKGAEGPYFNYTYTGSGYADAETCELTRAMYERFSKVGWVASDEEADTDDDGRAKKAERQYNETTASKF